MDNINLLKQWPDLFGDRSVLIRIDPGSGAGHHKFVSTAGNQSKFGIPREDIPELIALCKTLNIQVLGLHAHSGSGILTTDLWESTALFLTDFLNVFPHVRIINLGGGLGVAEKPGQIELNLQQLDQALLIIKQRFAAIEFWLEPGRYFVSDAGVLLTQVTQCKQKNKANFVGVNTGMNSLIRPALYGAYHEIVNLTKFDAQKTEVTQIVGPICESSDTLGYDRLLPTTQENDVILIANVGAYGYSMSSHYNLRAPAQELILQS